MYLPALSSESSLALYMQLYMILRHDMLANRLSSGTRLPSKRLLASGLGISINTVDSAYQQLVSEGYLEARAKSGYFVCDLGINISKMHGTVPAKPDPLDQNLSEGLPTDRKSTRL